MSLFSIFSNKKEKEKYKHTYQRKSVHLSKETPKSQMVSKRNENSSSSQNSSDSGIVPAYFIDSAGCSSKSSPASHSPSVDHSPSVSVGHGDTGGGHSSCSSSSSSCGSSCGGGCGGS